MKKIWYIIQIIVYNIYIMKKFIIVLTKDERTEIINGMPTPYQKPVCRTNKVYSVGDLFIMKLSLPDPVTNKEVKEQVLVQVEKIVRNIYFIKIPNTEAIK